ncbi:MAG: OB-fold domain-containing protein, partial [Myxococcota bacterium]
RCAACGTYNWYPPERCKSCGGAELPWRAVSGRGVLFSWAVVRHAFVGAFAGQLPYATGLVALAEDPAVRLVTKLVDCDPQDLRVDLPMRVVFRPLSFPDVPGEVVAPMFTPAV